MPDLDYGALRFWWDAAQTVIMGIIGWYLYHQSRESVTNKALKDLSGTVNTAIKDVRAVVEELSTSVDDDIEKLKSSVNTRMEKKDQRIDGLSERVSAVESRCEARGRTCPTHDDLSKIYQRVEGVGKQIADRHDETATKVDQLVGELKAMGGSVALIHQHLLDQSNNKGGVK